ncbi:HNH endonuclease [Leptothrix sp. BB-4]
MSRAAVYTIVNRALVQQALVQGQRGHFIEAKRWASASKAWRACVDDGLSYLLLLGDAAEIRGVEWVAEVESIEILPDDRTRVTFARLRMLDKAIPRSRLIKASNLQPLSNDYIKPYVPCVLKGAALQAVTAALAQPAAALQDWEPTGVDAAAAGLVGITQRDLLTTGRVGQDSYRAALMQLWQGRCALTGVDVPEVLIASHAKPWSECSDAERLDPHNGLLLAASVDRLFDAGLIGFDDDGGLLCSPLLRPETLRAIGVAPDARLARVDAALKPYLRHHRERHRLGDGVDKEVDSSGRTQRPSRLLDDRR